MDRIPCLLPHANWESDVVALSSVASLRSNSEPFFFRRIKIIDRIPCLPPDSTLISHTNWDSSLTETDSVKFPAHGGESAIGVAETTGATSRSSGTPPAFY